MHDYGDLSLDDDLHSTTAAAVAATAVDSIDNCYESEFNPNASTNTLNNTALGINNVLHDTTEETENQTITGDRAEKILTERKNSGKARELIKCIHHILH